MDSSETSDRGLPLLSRRLLSLANGACWGDHRQEYGPSETYSLCAGMQMHTNTYLRYQSMYYCDFTLLGLCTWISVKSSTPVMIAMGNTTAHTHTKDISSSRTTRSLTNQDLWSSRR